jgi:galactoside O-acetyltransferase
MSTRSSWFSDEVAEWFDAFVSAVPGRSGTRLRGLWLRQRLGALGVQPRIASGLKVRGGRTIFIGDRFGVLRNSALDAEKGRIEIGSRVSLNTNVVIDAADEGLIVIGDDVLVGPNCVVRASNHRFTVETSPIRDQGHSGGRIVICDDVWLGANVVVLPGVTIGSHSIVGAGAVVTHDVQQGTIVGGVPAREMGRLRSGPVGVEP